uniref:HDC07544 n=1 Tax=Drosophila melanogaster TaxID=7227 RepID=Q6IM41_DROME|nr:TPA_inf: HDC07544 [Drosophila melanogaster]
MPRPTLPTARGIVELGDAIADLSPVSQQEHSIKTRSPYPSAEFHGPTICLFSLRLSTDSLIMSPQPVEPLRIPSPPCMLQTGDASLG